MLDLILLYVLLYVQCIVEFKLVVFVSVVQHGVVARTCKCKQIGSHDVSVSMCCGVRPGAWSRHGECLGENQQMHVFVSLISHAGARWLGVVVICM